MTDSGGHWQVQSVSATSSLFFGCVFLKLLGADLGSACSACFKFLSDQHFTVPCLCEKGCTTCWLRGNHRFMDFRAKGEHNVHLNWLQPCPVHRFFYLTQQLEVDRECIFGMTSSLDLRLQVLQSLSQSLGVCFNGQLPFLSKMPFLWKICTLFFSSSVNFCLLKTGSCCLTSSAGLGSPLFSHRYFLWSLVYILMRSEKFLYTHKPS